MCEPSPSLDGFEAEAILTWEGLSPELKAALQEILKFYAECPPSFGPGSFSYALTNYWDTIDESLQVELNVLAEVQMELEATFGRF